MNVMKKVNGAPNAFQNDTETGLAVPVNKIIPLSVVDGPGCRTSIFLQSCNISCAYCHNPETQRMCRGCGKCVSECPAQALSRDASGTVIWEPEKCVQCDHCISICEYNASPKICWMDSGQAAEKVKESIPFIRGITVSGGECMLYPEFLTELFQKVKKLGLTCFIDSNGTIDFTLYPQLLAVCDKVMLDVKAWRPEMFHSLTGGTNEIVKKNLQFLAEQQKLEEVRIVCLDQEVDVEETIDGIAETVKDHLGEFTLKLIRFRRFGVRGRLAEAQSPSDEQMERWKARAALRGFTKIKIT